jgi:replicative DNA helicase
MLRQASKCVGHGRTPCTRDTYLGRRRKTNETSDEGRITNMANGQIENAYDGITDFEYRTHAKKRILSGFPLLDKLTKGFEVGCVTVWTGVSNVGKTTLLTAIMGYTFCFTSERLGFLIAETSCCSISSSSV